MDQKNVIAIIGGGAAGLMAAAYAAEICDPDTDEILLIEQNDRMGKKLRITGKGRCNLTNDCDRDEFLQNVPTNPRFLYTRSLRFLFLRRNSIFPYHRKNQLQILRLRKKYRYYRSELREN